MKFQDILDKVVENFMIDNTTSDSYTAYQRIELVDGKLKSTPISEEEIFMLAPEVEVK